MKRSLNLGVALFLLMTLLLVGCGQEKTSNENKDNVNLKVALILSGTANDQGWNAVAYDGLKLIEEKIGAKTAYAEKISQSDQEEAFRNYAEDGYDVIIAHGFEFGDAALKVAGDFPDIKFIVTSTDISQGPNVGSLDVSNTQQGFLQGVVAAVTTKTGIVAAIEGMVIPPGIQALQGFEAGAKYTNPDLTVLHAFTGDYEDAAKAKEVALIMIDKGADVIMQNVDQAGLGVFQAAVASDVLAIGSASDQSSLAPDNIITSGLVDFPQAFEKVVELIQNNQWEPQLYSMGVREGVISLAPYRNFDSRLTQEQKDIIQKAVDDIKAGKISPEEITKQLVEWEE